MSASARPRKMYPKVDLFAGYSYVHTEPGHRALFVQRQWRRRFRRVESHELGRRSSSKWAAFTPANIGGTDVDATAVTYMAGPKISLFHRSKLSPFAQALFGFAHTNPGFNQQPHQSQHISPCARSRARLECHAPLRNSSRPGGLPADAHPHFDQPGELEQLPLFRGRCVPLLISLYEFASRRRRGRSRAGNCKGRSTEFFGPFFCSLRLRHGCKRKITVIEVSTSTGSPFSMVGR